MYKILTLNNIAEAGLARLPCKNYEVGPDIQQPDAILLRSFKMQHTDIPASLKVIGRAGVGVNNIPLDKVSARGICVFNTPGANANAVKELVIAGMLMACRNIAPAWDFARNLEGSDAAINKATEAGKKNYSGFELQGCTLGVVGLGSIGMRIANAAIALGMKVIGFDPGITVKGAWQLDSAIEQASGVDDLLMRADFVTFHVPLVDTTRDLINAERLQRMKERAVILNFARAGIVDDEAVVAALNAGRIYAYVCDFPTNLLKSHPRTITLPHLGASTHEAEENCAIMAVEQVRDYLENGNVTNSVNFPEVVMPRSIDAYRLAVVNSNVPNMLGQISSNLARAGFNIIDMLNKSHSELAYTLVDVDKPVADGIGACAAIAKIDGILNVRVIP